MLADISCPGSLEGSSEYCETRNQNNMMAAWQGIHDRLGDIHQCEGDDCEKTIYLTLVDEGKACISNGGSGTPRRGRIFSYKWTVFCIPSQKEKKKSKPKEPKKEKSSGKSKKKKK